MPQMMPLNWLILMIFFTMIFYLFNNLTYFIFSYSFKSTNISKNKTFFNWKW
nr:ATP synthase F0 subunit 8 [Aphthona sp. EMHAU-15071309]